MADSQRVSLAERDIDQAITALKKGAYLLKYGRRGSPKFCPFRLSNDESTLIWYYGKEEKQLKLHHVSRIIPGQRTAIFQRYPRPEKEYQSFSLIYNDRSLDLICKDKEEAEVWFVGLKALISRGSHCKLRNVARIDSVSSDSPRARKTSPSNAYCDQRDTRRTESLPQSSLGKAFADIISYTAVTKNYTQAEPVTNSLSSISSVVVDNSNGRSSAAETFRFSLSSAVSSSSQGSCHEDFDALGDVFIWGEGIGDGVLGGGVHRVGNSSGTKLDALLPKALESTVVLDVHNLACGGRHAVLVTKQGEIFSWGEESGGRLGHGVEEDVSYPKLINTLSGMNIELVACGEYHTCALTLSGDLYTWGDGSHNSGLLGHGSEASHWIPKKVSGLIEGIQVSYISCGPWHTAVVTSGGQLFTFGDGTFGALGHGDRNSTSVPKEVETLKGLRTMRVSCGVWHTAAVVEVTLEPSTSGSPSIGKLFTWGDGDKGQLGHGDKEPRLVPSCVAVLDDTNFCQVACGNSITIALATSGQVYTMGCADYGQLGNPGSSGKLPTCIEGKIRNNFIEEIACGSHHVAVLSSKSEVYTWGKGANGQLGHGDNDDRNSPALVRALKDKHVKSVVCGSNFTAAICLHKWVCNADNSICFGCHNPFNFRRKRHNCYNCGLVFCKACSSKKSLKASLAPNMNKPYRVCDDCFNKLKKAMESGSTYRFPKVNTGNIHRKSSEVKERESLDHKSHSLLSRLSSFDSCKQAETGYSKQKRKLDSNSGHATPSQNGSCQTRISHTSNSSTSTFEYSERISSFIAGSRTDSLAASPISIKSTHSHSMSLTAAFASLACPDVILDDSKRRDDANEISILRAQVEDLTHKSQLLEAEIERTSRQLKEATDLARKETEKNKAAKEVIKSLTWQMKEMAERVPQGSSVCRKPDSFSENTSSTLSLVSTWSHLTC
uniref:FYVE-type domain-containing protein n=1 Tax=Davidia involucrata TaxID=16924 RepID=A0A5B7BJ92_DAVIN